MESEANGKWAGDGERTHDDKACVECGAALSKPLRCSLCKARLYCSRECQIKDWTSGHKKMCLGKKADKQASQSCDPGMNGLTKEKHEEMAIAEIYAANPRLKYMPLITSSTVADRVHLRAFVDKVAQSLPGDFCWSPSFSAPFIAALMYEGFLPMADRVAGGTKYCLIPKLHRKRCLVDLGSALHMPLASSFVAFCKSGLS